MQGAVKNFNDFKVAFNGNNLKKASTLLSTLKIELTQFAALPPVFAKTPTAQQELLLAREVLEHAVLLSVKLRDEAAFERNFLQVQTYYTDTRTLLPPSQQEHPILGLNLLRLLVQNRIAEFHTELELIGPEVHKNVYVNYAIELEQCIMEGAYNKVLSRRKDVPAEFYGYFMDLLMETIRDEIAGCAEKAYHHLTVADANKMLMFKTSKECEAYAAERGWEVRGGNVCFQPEGAAACGLPSLELIANSLSYAKELERIV